MKELCYFLTCWCLEIPFRKRKYASLVFLFQPKKKKKKMIKSSVYKYNYIFIVMIFFIFFCLRYTATQESILFIQNKYLLTFDGR